MPTRISPNEVLIVGPNSGQLVNLENYMPRQNLKNNNFPLMARDISNTELPSPLVGKVKRFLEQRDTGKSLMDHRLGYWLLKEEFLSGVERKEKEYHVSKSNHSPSINIQLLSICFWKNNWFETLKSLNKLVTKTKQQNILPKKKTKDLITMS